MLQREVCLADLRVLEVGVKEGDVLSRSDGRSRKNYGESRRARRAGVKTKGRLAARHSGCSEAAKDSGVNDASIVDTPAAAQNRLTVTEYVPGETDART